MEKASSQEDQFIHSLRSGSKAEIWSEEDGYQNAWFSCKIVHPPPPSYTPTGRKRKKRMAFVKYDHMLDTGGEPLAERVDIRFIRPPPPFDSLGQPFELYDVVDAFFNDVWWTGFVVKVVDDRYTVAFKKPLDLQEFRRSDLRTHLDWINSSWVRPEKEDTTGLIYIPGTEVEVNRLGEVPCHAWLPAVVIGKVESTDSFLVKYKNSYNDGEEVLKEETIDLKLIRPCPPKMKDGDFNVLEKVDAFYGSCWWVGLITKLQEGKRYFVTLRHEKEMEFSHSELRPHLEWTGRHWVPESKGVQFTSDRQEQIRDDLNESSGSALDDTEKDQHCLSDKQVSQKELSPHVENSPDFRCSNMEKENHICSGEKPIEVIPDGDDERTKQQEAGEMENEAVMSPKDKGRPQKSHERSGSTLVDSGNEQPCLSDVHNNQKELGPHVKNLSDFGCSNMEKENHILSSDKPIEAIPSGDEEKTKQQEAGEIENGTVISPKNNGRPQKSHESSGSTLVDTENERPCLSNTRDNQKELSHCLEDSSDFEWSNMEEGNHISSGDRPVEVIPSGDNERTKQQEAGEMKNQAIISYKKRGRSQKSQAFTSWPRKCRRDVLSRSNSKGALQNIADTKSMEVNQVMIETIEACNLIENFEGLNGTHGENCCQFPIENEQNGDAKTSGEMKGNGDNPELLVVNSQCAAGDSSTEKSESLAITKAILTLTDTMEGYDATLVSPMPVKYYDQALVMHVEETHTPTNVGELAMVGTASTDNIVRADVQNLPFVKNYPVWQLIQSMEVFKELPQNPKFQPLVKHIEVKREGQAIACMLTFANLVDKVSKLQETDSIQDMESMMEALVELEEMGFNVTEVRGRLSKLIEFKVMLEKLNHKLNGIEVDIKECSDGKSKIDGEVAEMDKEITAKSKIDGEVAEMDKEMRRLEEKQADLMAKRMEMTSRELALISESHAVYRDISRTMEGFGRLVTTSWRLANGA